MESPTQTQRSSARSLLLQWLITGVAIYGALVLVPGITFTGKGYEIGILALIYSVINVIVRPVLLVLSIPLVVLTMGLFMVVVNAVLLLMTAHFAHYMGIEFRIDTLFTAIVGAIVISLISMLLQLLTSSRR